MPTVPEKSQVHYQAAKAAYVPPLESAHAEAPVEALSEMDLRSWAFLGLSNEVQQHCFSSQEPPQEHICHLGRLMLHNGDDTQKQDGFSILPMQVLLIGKDRGRKKTKRAIKLTFQKEI